MYCRICGDEKNVKYRVECRQALCDSCYKDTPPKIGFSEFVRRYFNAIDDPCNAIQREFYSDYLASNLNFTQYQIETTESI